MKVTLKKNSTTMICRAGKEYNFSLGEKEIQDHGFQVVDYLVENIVCHMCKGEEIFVEGNSLQATMIGRKLEDKIKRDVVFINENRMVYL